MKITLTTDTQDEIVRALGHMVSTQQFAVHQCKANHSDHLRFQERMCAQAIAAYNEVAEQLNIKPIDPND